MAELIYTNVQITSAADTSSGMTILLSGLGGGTLGTELHARTLGTLAVPPLVKLFMEGAGEFYIDFDDVSSTQFIVRGGLAVGAFPVPATIIIEPQELLSSTSAAKSSTNSRVRRILKDTTAIDTNRLILDAELNERIDDAVERFSKDSPRILSRNVVGEQEHDVPLPSDWQNDFSTIDVPNGIEYPGGNVPQQYLEDDNWEIFLPDEEKKTIANASSGASSVTLSTTSQAIFFKDGDRVEVGDDTTNENIRIGTDGVSSTGVVVFKSGETLSNTYNTNPFIRKVRVLRLQHHTPETSEFVTLRFRAKHIHTDAQDTIPESEFELFTHLVASFAAETIANKFRSATDSISDADSVDHLAKAEMWEKAASRHMNIYEQHLAIGADTEVEAAFGEIDVDTSFSWGNDFIFHPRQWR